MTGLLSSVPKVLKYPYIVNNRCSFLKRISSNKKRFYQHNCVLYLLFITVVSSTMYSLMRLNFTTKRHVYFPPSWTPTFVRFSGPKKSSGSFASGSGCRTLSNNLPSLYQEILFSGVLFSFPLSVRLQKISMLSPGLSRLESGTFTFGISFPEMQNCVNHRARFISHLVYSAQVTGWVDFSVY